MEPIRNSWDTHYHSPEPGSCPVNTVHRIDGLIARAHREEWRETIASALRYYVVSACEGADVDRCSRAIWAPMVRLELGN